MRRALVALKKNGGTGVIRRETIGTPGAITQRVASRLSQELDGDGASDRARVPGGRQAHGSVVSLTWGLPIVGPGEVVPGMHKSEAQCSFVHPNECDCDAHSGYAGLKRMLDGQRLHTNTCALETTGSGFDCGCQRCCHHEWCPECGYSLLIFEDGERSRRPAPKPGATAMLTGHFDCRDWRNKITVDRYRSGLPGSPFIRR